MQSSHLYAAFCYSLQGLRTAFQQEVAFRQISCVSLLLIPGAFWLTDHTTERILLIGAILLILIVELINSSLERVVDRISTASHPLSKEAKDLGSAATFIACLLAITIWLMIIIA
jgi:diacylglycerol kinase (ATP)